MHTVASRDKRDATRYHGAEHEVVSCLRANFLRQLLECYSPRGIYTHTYRSPIFCKNLEKCAYIIPTGCARDRSRYRLCESCVRACGRAFVRRAYVCTYVCIRGCARARINFVKAFKGTVSSVPYSPLGTFVDRRALFDIHDKTGLSSWLRCKRAQLHGSLWRRKRRKKKSGERRGTEWPGNAMGARSWMVIFREERDD